MPGYTDVLNGAGYKCGISGKWHLGDSHHPQKGFDYWAMHAKGGGPYYNAPMVDAAWRGVVTRDGWKYVAFENNHWLLFNLNEDPYELANLAHNAAFRDIRGKLNRELARWIKDTNDEFQLPE